MYFSKTSWKEGEVWLTEELPGAGLEAEAFQAGKPEGGTDLLFDMME